jgi:hypothetical protein
VALRGRLLALAERDGARQLVILRLRERCRHRLVRLIRGAAGQDVAAGLAEPAEDGHDLLDGLARAEDRLREAVIWYLE